MGTETNSMSDTQYLEFLVRGIVEFRENIRVVRSTDEMGVLMELEVDKRDMGKVIGREGNTAKAIRTLMKCFGMKNNSRINVMIIEPEQ